MRSTFLLMTVVAALAACTDSPTAVADSAPLFAKSANAGGRVIASASGSGHALCSDDGATCDSQDGDLALRTFSFTAQLHEDGSARGKAQFNNRGREQAWDADIGCVLFRPSKPNQVWMLGTLTRGYGQAPNVAGLTYEVGTRVLFAVEDNGEGSAATAPDRLVGLAPLPEATYQGLCPVFNAQVEALPFDFFMSASGFEAIRGNVQVRPPSAD